MENTCSVSMCGRGFVTSWRMGKTEETKSQEQECLTTHFQWLLPPSRYQFLKFLEYPRITAGVKHLTHKPMGDKLWFHIYTTTNREMSQVNIQKTKISWMDSNFRGLVFNYFCCDKLFNYFLKIYLFIFILRVHVFT